MQAKPRFRIGSDGTNLRPVGLPALTGKVSSEFMRGGQSPFFFGWNPALRDTREDVRAAYTTAAARAIDTLQNSGWLAGAVRQSVASTVGVALRLASKPDAEQLGWTKDEASAWARIVERRWEEWASNPLECDAAGKHTIGQQTCSVLRMQYGYGEAVALLPMIDRPMSQTRTKVKLVPPHKLTQDTDNLRMYQGVVMDEWGMPLGYRMRLRINQPYEETVTVAARDGAMRPQVIHVFEGDPDQVRGITPLVPILKVFRQYDQLHDAKLTQELIRAIFAATVKSDAPTSEVLNALQDDDEQGVGGGDIDKYLGAKTEWYQSTKIDLGRAGRIAHLFPGETLEFHNSTAPSEAYEALTKFLLRESARCLGLTFEGMTGDYSNATYSSVRMATSENWPVVLTRRQNIPARFCQITYEAWLEEEVDKGRIPFKGGFIAFLAQRRAACRADWRGPAKPQADDLKAQKAHEGYKRMGVMTDEMICADLGVDWEDVYEQRAREKALREKLDLPEGDTLNTAADDALTNALATQED